MSTYGRLPRRVGHRAVSSKYSGGRETGSCEYCNETVWRVFASVNLIRMNGVTHL